MRMAIQQRNRERAQRDERIRASVRVAMAVKGINMERMARILGISRTTLYHRMEKPGTFTVDEIDEIQRLGGQHETFKGAGACASAAGWG